MQMLRFDFTTVKPEVAPDIQNSQNAVISSAFFNIQIFGRQGPFLLYRMDVGRLLTPDPKISRSKFFRMQNSFAFSKKCIQNCAAYSAEG